MGPREHREEERYDEGDVQQSLGGQVDHCWTGEHFRVSVVDGLKMRCVCDWILRWSLLWS